MDKLRDVTMKLFQSVGPEHKISVHEHINNFISNFKPPDHPPYAAMIHRAIEELNEKRGSSEQSISRHIKKLYTNLPLAHNSLLTHHLGELCNSGEILVTGKHLYLLPGNNPPLENPPLEHPPMENPPLELKRTMKGSGRISKKDKESGETYGEPKRETVKCKNKKDELTGAHNEVKVDYNVRMCGESTHVVNPTLEFGVTSMKDQPKRKRTRRGSGTLGKKDEGSDKNKETDGEAKGGGDRSSEEKEAQDGELPLQVEEAPRANMEIDNVTHAQKTAVVPDLTVLRQ